jgi:Flp pilus assembly CpaF family ATPase
MNLDEKIKQLCRALIDCESEKDVRELVQELQPLLQRKLDETHASLDGS